MFFIVFIYNTRAILNKITYMYKRSHKKLYKILTLKNIFGIITIIQYKRFSSINQIIKSLVNFLLVLVVTSYTEKFQNFKKENQIILQLFKTKHISIQYYEPWNKRLWQNLNLDFKGFKIVLHSDVLHRGWKRKSHYDDFTCGRFPF